MGIIHALVIPASCEFPLYASSNRITYQFLLVSDESLTEGFQRTTGYGVIPKYAFIVPTH